MEIGVKAARKILVKLTTGGRISTTEHEGRPNVISIFHLKVFFPDPY
jgi:hypothetical protein